MVADRGAAPAGAAPAGADRGGGGGSAWRCWRSACRSRPSPGVSARCPTACHGRNCLRSVWPAVVELLPSALIIAFLAGVESLLSAMVADRMIAGAPARTPRCWRRGPISARRCSAGCRRPGPSPHRDQRPGRRPDARGRDRPCAGGSADDDAGRPPGRADGDAGAGGTADPDRLEHVRAASLAGLSVRAPVGCGAAFADAGADGGRGPDRRHRNR
jgi:hypothetical protein